MQNLSKTDSINFDGLTANGGSDISLRIRRIGNIVLLFGEFKVHGIYTFNIKVSEKFRPKESIFLYGQVNAAINARNTATAVLKPNGSIVIEYDYGENPGVVSFIEMLPSSFFPNI